MNEKFSCQYSLMNMFELNTDGQKGWTEGAATLCQITQRNCHKTSMLLNVYVPKCIITKRSCNATKAVIKRQTLQKVNITKRQMFQNITSQNKNCHKTTKNV